MSDFNSSPIALSHKQLNKLLASAPKEKFTSTDDQEMSSEIEKEFNNLLLEWTTISKKLLSNLKNIDNNPTNKKRKRSLMALGALESYLLLAIQAKEASELE